VLSRIRHCLSQATLQGLYYSLIFPYLSYCNICWASTYSFYLKKLESLQKRAIRTIFLLCWSVSTKPIFRTYNILRLSDIYKFQISLFMFRYHHKLLPRTFDGYFCQGIAVHNHFTRTLLHYRTDVAHTRMKLFSIKCSGPMIWNNLPKYITLIPTINMFKKKLKDCLISVY